MEIFKNVMSKRAYEGVGHL